MKRNKKEWNENDFVKSVSQIMKRQENEYPPIKQIHARLSPEWKEATKLVNEIMFGTNKTKVDELVEKLVNMGEIATRALIGFLLDLKSNEESENEK